MSKLKKELSKLRGGALEDAVGSDHRKSEEIYISSSIARIPWIQAETCERGACWGTRYTTEARQSQPCRPKAK